METPSPHGAAVAGDEYQHAYTLTHAMRLLAADTDVTGIKMEVSHAGNVDDLIVEYADRPPLYHQIKFVMTQGVLLTYTWFMQPAAGGGKSILQKFHDSFKLLHRDGDPPEMALVTNRALAGDDPLFVGVLDGRDAKLMPRIAAHGPQSKAGKALAEWAKHLGIERDELERMLSHLQIRTDTPPLEGLRDLCRLHLEACGLPGNREAVMACIGEIRNLVIAGQGRKSAIDRDQWQQIIDGLNLVLEEPSASIVIEAVRPHHATDVATAHLDWLDRFADESHRQLKNPDDWGDVLWRELTEAADLVRASGKSRVELTGHMRLSTGLAIASRLPATSGTNLYLHAYGARWDANGDANDFEIESEQHDLDRGDQLAIGLSTTGDLTGDVLDWISKEALPIKTFINVRPADGYGPRALPSPADARGWAQTTMRAIREAAKAHEQPLHLFQYGPLFGAVLLGAIWNRMPQTVLYDDAANAYTPTFTLPPS